MMRMGPPRWLSCTPHTSVSCLRTLASAAPRSLSRASAAPGAVASVAPCLILRNSAGAGDRGEAFPAYPHLCCLFEDDPLDSEVITGRGRSLRRSVTVVERLFAFSGVGKTICRRNDLIVFYHLAFMEAELHRGLRYTRRGNFDSQPLSVVRSGETRGRFEP